MLQLEHYWRRLINKCERRLIDELFLEPQHFIVKHFLEGFWNGKQVSYNLRPLIILISFEGTHKNHFLLVVVNANEDTFDFDKLAFHIFERSGCWKELSIGCHYQNICLFLEAEDIWKERFRLDRLVLCNEVYKIVLQFYHLRFMFNIKSYILINLKQILQFNCQSEILTPLKSVSPACCKL